MYTLQVICKRVFEHVCGPSVRHTLTHIQVTSEGLLKSDETKDILIYKSF